MVLTHGPIIPCQRVEQVPEGHPQTFLKLALAQLGSVLGCTGFLGSSCSECIPQLLSRHVAFPTVPGGIHCCIVVPPMDEWIRPMGTGCASFPASAAAKSDRDLPKYLLQKRFSPLIGKDGIK